jgi:Spy/CpxP family protein refolding chaperone
MRYQQGITLQDAQRTRIIAEMSQAQAKFTEIQWTMSGEEEKLERLLQEPAPGEQAVIAQMDRILSLEQNLKRTQMVLLVRVKNILTPEQQTTLSRLQRGVPATPGAQGRGGRGGGTGGSAAGSSSGGGDIGAGTAGRGGRGGAS